ncbi:MAG TPA: hypothetical protein VFJ43_04480, partial [Bacteroidia bacterium]|nr:hypothetical protein [Bacteroidia bacterium]
HRSVMQVDAGIFSLKTKTKPVDDTRFTNQTGAALRFWLRSVYGLSLRLSWGEKKFVNFILIEDHK